MSEHEPSPHNGERLVMVTDEHWVKYVLPVTVSALILIVTLLLFGLAGLSAYHFAWVSAVTFVAATFLLHLSVHWLFMILLSEAIDRIILTNKRLLRVQYRLIFHDDVLEVAFNKMRVVDARKSGFIQNLLHYGSLVFEGTLSIPLVRHPNRMARTIEEIMLAAQADEAIPPLLTPRKEE